MNERQNEKIALLQQIFDNVNNWLHFAEAKNAALIAFDIAFIAAMFTIDLSETFLFEVIIIALSISIFVVLYSFKPINKELEKPYIKNMEVNLLHFAYIATLETRNYIEKLYSFYWNEENKDINSVSKLEKDYCREIIINARITLRKQQFFKIGLYIVLVVVVLFILLIILKKV